LLSPLSIFCSVPRYILGEAPECRGFFVAAGFNSAGIANAAGAGILTAEWLTSGHPDRDVWGIDIRRFAPFHAAPAFLRDRVAEVLGLHYQMPWPRREMQSARGLRCTPLHAAHTAAGAVFGQKFGWERVNYFVPPELSNAKEARNAAAVPTIASPPSWLEYARREHLHTRSHVSLFDLSSFAKILVQGAGAQALLDKLCCANLAMDVAGAPGGIAQASRVVYTGMLNEHGGGYEADVTVSRIGPDSYLVVSPTAQATRDADHIRRHVRTGDDVRVSDVSGSYSVLALMGPQSRELLTRLTTAALDDASFPFGTSQCLHVGHVAVRANRVTYVGELGYELYVPPDGALALYNALHAAANGEWREIDKASESGMGRDQPSGPHIALRDGGYYAVDSLRLEAGYRAWGHELGVSDTPLEAGLAFTVDWSKPFLGREKLLEKRAAGFTQRLVCLHVAATDLPLWGSEPIMRDGVTVGNVTSAGYAHSVGGQVALGYVSHPDASKLGFVKTGVYHINVGGTLLPATASLKPLLDPKRRVQGDYTK
jgi:4-methylaminobutanoate oxidase (formaldehyde-forming)